MLCPAAVEQPGGKGSCSTLVLVGENASVQLTKTFSADQYTRALESWTWLDFTGKTPLFASLFGDVFFEAGDGCWHLDTLDGEFARVWDSREAMEASLATPEGQDHYLLGGLAMSAERSGITLDLSEVYDLAPPPILGGPLKVENITKMDFVVALNIAGQIHDQVRGLPPGTKISGVTIDGEKP